MLFLLFQLGQDRYALEANHVVEVVPVLSLRRLPHAPPGVAGIINYRGEPVPAVDLSQLTLGAPARELLSTRIIIVRHPDANGRNQLLGLIAEQATGLLRTNPADFVDSGVRLGAAPYLGPLLMDAKGPIQWLHEQRLLSAPMRDLLFTNLHTLEA